jgi:prepilin-type N-terminal cleavage/methylation domain-containing protein
MKIEKKRFQNQKGVTLVEVLIATGILAIAVGGITALQIFSLKQSQSILQRSDFIKSLQSMEADLVQDMDSIPHRQTSSFISGLDFDSDQMKKSFDDEESLKTCFTSLGFRVDEKDSTCEIKVSYYKVREDDRLYSADQNLAQSNFKSTPISRLLYRVTFFDKGVNQSRIYYFSRLKTHILSM